jgi:coenzyme F420-reducing hydrogenase delta subunit
MKPFDLFLFSTNATFVRDAVAAGIDGIIVDWETRGKDVRQASADTQINYDTLDDLRRVRAATTARVICRINGVGATTACEIEHAIDAGADEILLPMVRTPAEVVSVLEMVRGRCGAGILIETTSAAACAGDLAALPLSRIYVGLNDLAIDRGSASIFDAVADGTLERVRRACRGTFGFGGLTLPSRGAPIPCRLLIAEMSRLECSFSFLRRSFHRDLAGVPLEHAVTLIREGLDAARARSSAAIARDRDDLRDSIRRLRTPDAAFR